MQLWFDVQALQGPFFERGIQRYVRAVATELERRRAPVVAFGTNPSQRDPYEQHGAVATSRLLRRADAAALRAAAAEHTDLVYLCGSAFEGFRPIQDLWPNYTVIPGVPAAAIVYDTIPFRRPHEFQATRERRSFYAARRMLLEQADRFLAISESSAREAIEDFGLDPASVAVIGCGVDERFVPTDDAERTMDELVGDLPSIGAPYVLYVGGFQPQKNVEGLLTAYAALDDAIRAEHQLVIGGSVPLELRATWEHRVEELGLAERVVFTGLVSDDTLLRLYQCARLLVFPSLHEGFGLPVAEAIACGTPAICSNTSSLPEVIGWEPATFDPTDPAAIAAAIERALTDAAHDEALRAACRSAAGRHTWARVVDTLLAELAPLAALPRGAVTPQRIAVVATDPAVAVARAGTLDTAASVVDVFAGAGSHQAGRFVAPVAGLGRTADPALYDEVVYCDPVVEETLRRSAAR